MHRTCIQQFGDDLYENLYGSVYYDKDMEEKHTRKAKRSKGERKNFIDGEKHLQPSQAKMKQCPSHEKMPSKVPPTILFVGPTAPLMSTFRYWMTEIANGNDFD